MILSETVSFEPNSPFVPLSGRSMEQMVKNSEKGKNHD